MRALFGALCASALLAATAASAQGAPPPARDVGARHGNIEAAQTFTRQAYNALSQAQQANNQAAGGHIARAKALLDQASAEMKAAAVFLNHH